MWRKGIHGNGNGGDGNGSPVLDHINMTYFVREPFCFKQEISTRKDYTHAGSLE